MKTALVMGWWVVDADIQSFDSIDHEQLLRFVQRRIPPTNSMASLCLTRLSAGSSRY